MSPGRQQDPLWEMTKQKSWGVSWSYHISLNKRKPAWRLHPLDACICFWSFSVATGLGFNQVTMPSVLSELLVVFSQQHLQCLFPNLPCGFPSLGHLSFWSWLLSDSCRPHSSEVLFAQVYAWLELLAIYRPLWIWWGCFKGWLWENPILRLMEHFWCCASCVWFLITLSWAV